MFIIAYGKSGIKITLIFLYLCHLLKTIANSLDPDEAQQNVGPDLDPICLTLRIFLKEFFKKVDFEKNSRQQKSITCKFSQYAMSSSFPAGGHMSPADNLLFGPSYVKYVEINSLSDQILSFLVLRL